MGSILVLNYKEIIADESIGSKFSVKKSEFIKQLNLIQELEINVVAAQDWIDNKVKADFAIVLTFEGGHASDLKIVKPALLERGYTATFFPVLGLLNKEKRLRIEELKELSDLGFEIGSQGVLNCNLKLLNKEAKKLELELSKRILEKTTGKAIDSFSVPAGLYNRQILQLAHNAGYKRVFGSKAEINDNHQSFVIQRWNIKNNTSLTVLKKKIMQGVNYSEKTHWISKIKNQLSIGFGIGFMSKANAAMLKLIEKQ